MKPQPTVGHEHREGLTRCVVYAAKSTEDVRGSIPDQVADCEAEIERRGGQVVTSYTDEAVSAFTGSRGPGLTDAMEHAEDLAMQFGAAELWAQHSDRFARGDGRSARHTVEIALWALKGNVSVRTVQDPDTFRDLLYAVVTGQRNHEDSRRKGLAMAAGRRKAALKGEYVGYRPDGYRIAVDGDDLGRVEKRMVIDPKRREVIELIFRLGLRGRSGGQIARTLNDRGWLTNFHSGRARPERWASHSVCRVLTNPRYAGLAVVDGKVAARGNWPAYITERQHQRLCDLNAARRPKQKLSLRRESYLLASLLRCGVCGQPFYCVTGKQMADETRQRRYVCASHDRDKHVDRCHTPRISADMLEAMLVACLRTFLQPSDPHGEASGPSRVHDLSLERSELRQASLTDDEQAFADALERLIARRGAPPPVGNTPARVARQLETVKLFEALAAAELKQRNDETRAQTETLNKVLKDWFSHITVVVTDATVTLTATRRLPTMAPVAHRERTVLVDRRDWTRVAYLVDRPRTRGRSWSAAEIVGALQAAAQTAGRSPSRGEWQRAATNHPNHQTVVRHFGTWPRALRAAGLAADHKPPQPRNRRWDRALVIDALRAWTASNGRAPKRADWLYAGQDCPNNQTATRLFGSWEAAVAAAAV
jgi:site-specific DNA recombinase